MRDLDFSSAAKNTVAIVDLADRSMSSYLELTEGGFIEQRYRSKQIDPADVQQLEAYLNSTNCRTATQKDLVFHLVMECFQNKHSKHYVKKLVHHLATKLLSDK